MRKLFYLCILSGFVLTIASCGNKKAQTETSAVEDFIKENPRYDTTMVRSHDDSTTIVKLSTDYLDLLKQGNIDEALNLLYELSDSSNVKPLSDSRKNEIKNNLLRFPVLSYTIDEFRLYTDFDTDVRYTYVFMEKPANAPENLPNTMKGVLNPVRIGSNWYLTVSSMMTDTERNNSENSKYSTNITEENENN